MDTGNRFSQCLLEQKNEESRQAKRLRRRTVLIAILIQAVALGLLMLRPLFGASAESLMIARFVPGVPWRGSRESRGPARPRPPADIHHPVHDVSAHPLTFYFPDRPTTNSYSGEAPEIGSGNDAPSGPGIGDPNGPLPNIGLPGFNRSVPPPPREPDAPPRKPRVVDSKIQEAKLVTRIDPVYPILAKQIRLEGTVVIRAIISKEGCVESEEILSGHPWLAHAAMEAIAQWRYQPTLLNGQPVEVETMITVIFKMH